MLQRLLQPLEFLVLNGVVLHAILGRIITFGVADMVPGASKLLDEGRYPEFWDLVVEYCWREIAESTPELLAELCVFGRCTWVIRDGHITRHDPYLGSS
jgi:hypothetical protein